MKKAGIISEIHSVSRDLTKNVESGVWLGMNKKNVRRGNIPKLPVQ